MSPIIIRPVKASDLQSIISLVNREITGGINIFRLVPLDDVAAQRWWIMHGEGRYQAVVAERISDASNSGPGESNSGPGENRPTAARFAGWATLTPHSAYEGYDRTAELSVWVEPDARRCGCGRALVRSLLESCTERNFRTVISRIESTNTASLRLHEDCGFTRVGLLKDVGEKFGQSLSVVFMQYHVPAAQPIDTQG
jgi:L-amino acid N-acyltransferase